MNKRFISTFFLIAYSALLIKVMVFRSIPTIRIGHMMFNLGGSDANGNANFVPFKSIVEYVSGQWGILGFVVNLVGNIVILIPFGFLLVLTFRNISWKKTLAVAIALPLLIEIVQLLTHMGIFDIDDVILNGLGIMLGFWAFVIFAKWGRKK
jgi:glycopeptide antibiotics resistance protein